MLEQLEDPVDVRVTFDTQGHINPTLMRWRGRVYRIRVVTDRWKGVDVIAPAHHFNLHGAAGERFQLRLNAWTLRWVLLLAWT